NGVCRAIIESLRGAMATALARPDEVGSAMGALRFWKPISILSVALAGSWLAERHGVGSILLPLAAVQTLGFAVAFFIHEDGAAGQVAPRPRAATKTRDRKIWNDRALFAFVVAMISFHVANSPGGVYLGLFLKRDLHAADRYLAYSFVVSMITW